MFFFEALASNFKSISNLPVKVMPGFIIETDTLSSFPCMERVFEKWFNYALTEPPIIKVLEGFSQVPAPPPIFMILPLLN